MNNEPFLQQDSAPAPLQALPNKHVSQPKSDTSLPRCSNVNQLGLIYFRPCERSKVLRQKKHASIHPSSGTMQLHLVSCEDLVDPTAVKGRAWPVGWQTDRWDLQISCIFSTFPARAQHGKTARTTSGMATFVLNHVGLLAGWQGAARCSAFSTPKSLDQNKTDMIGVINQWKDRQRPGNNIEILSWYVTWQCNFGQCWLRRVAKLDVLVPRSHQRHKN